MPASSRLSSSDVRSAGELPHVEPIALVPRAEPFDDPGTLFEPKYDGFRGFIYASSQGCEIRSRRDFPFDRFGELYDRVREVLYGREVILDGEVVALNRKGKPVFRDLLRGQGFMAYAACDLLWLDGSDLRSLPLSERKRMLGELLPEDTARLYKILTLEECGRALYRAIAKMDLEGIVAKRKEDRYDSKTVWYRILNPAYGQSEGRRDPFRRREWSGR